MSDEEHRELLTRVNADDIIRKIRFHENVHIFVIFSGNLW